MKNKLFSYILFLSTIVIIAIYPMIDNLSIANTVPLPFQPHQETTAEPLNPQNEKYIDVVFVLDTTGSMGGLIQAAKEKIWSIASTMASAQNKPHIRMGLVAYRDRGDNYVTQTVDLTSNLDAMYSQLMNFQASGGGDGPESVNQALDDAVNKMSWSQNHQAYKVIFLLGDAPPHMDYQDDIKYPQTIELANRKGIIVNAIQCGNNVQTSKQWQHIASLSQGDYFQVNQSGSAVTITTPFDKNISELSRDLEESIVVYGSQDKRKALDERKQQSKNLQGRLSEASSARRALFNSTASGRENSLTENDLIAKIAAGKLKIEELNEKALPASIAKLPQKEQAKLIKTKIAERQRIKTKLKKVMEARTLYLKKEVAKVGGLKDSLDSKIFDSVKKQARDKGIEYKADVLSY